MPNNPKKISPTISDLLAPGAARVEEDLGVWLVEPGTPAELAEAMAYCTSGGKRLRPALVHLSAEATGTTDDADAELIRRAAVAVELVHCYSLVHDDLPAMDDDALRRGRPTAHVQFGQATAILVGDALLTRAFGVLGESSSPRAAGLVGELAAAAGAAGMVAGQAADMHLCTTPGGPEGLQYVPARKTGAMIRAAARMGALGAAAPAEGLEAVSQFAEKLGLAFQLFDDLLDATGSAEQLGKTPGKDAKAGKRTHLAKIGFDAAHALAQTLTEKAIEALAPLGAKGDNLRALAILLTERKS